MSDLKKTLESRHSQYGSYSAASLVRAQIMVDLKDLYFKHHLKEMPTIDFLCITDVINKVCRLAVTPSHLDSWHDIAGYATKIETFYKEQQNAHKQ